MHPRVVKINDSENVHMMTYNPETEVLIVVFKDHTQSKYRYSDIPGDVVGRVAFSKSVGSALRKLIADKYVGVKI